MVSPSKQLLFLLLFVGLVGSVFVLRGTLPQPSRELLNRKEAIERYGFHFEEVSKTCGIDFVHQAPVCDSKLDPIMPLVAATGAAVSVVDFDRDGWNDLYVINSGPNSKNRLYRNKQDGTFEDVAEAMGVADLNRFTDGACMGAVWGDYDNDGYEDLLVYRWGKPELFHNDRGKGFTRVTEKAGLPKWINAGSAIWLDFDCDGHLDFFIAGYWADEVNLFQLESTRIMPESFKYAKNGGRKYLMRNQGDGTFQEVGQSRGITSTRWTLAAAASDLRDTGYPDIVLANDYGVSEFFANHHGTHFEDIGEATSVGSRPKSGMSVSFGDVFNQGRFCIYVTNINEPGILVQGNNLWVPARNTKGENLRYDERAGSLGADMGGWSWSAQFGDLNNDGNLDLFLTNGFITTDHADSYWYDYSRITGAHSEIIQDAANWPAMRGKSLAGRQQKCLWLNRGGRFDDIAKAVGVTDTFDGRAVAFVDLWNRGVLDVVLANQKGPLLIYKNTVKPENAWIQFELEGTKSNKSAVGAQVRLFWNDQVQLQEVSGGCGYASQNQRRLHFGLGENPKIDRAEIRWASGRTQIIRSPQTGKLHRIMETE